jgi:ribosomal protein S8E
MGKEEEDGRERKDGREEEKMVRKKLMRGGEEERRIAVRTEAANLKPDSRRTCIPTLLPRRH